MKIGRFIILLFFVGNGAQAASQKDGFSTFDVYLAPYISPSYGSYEADDVDKGTSIGAQYGGRLGFKLGPILIGGEFGSGLLFNSSSAQNITESDRIKYAVGGSGELTQLGLHVGHVTDRWMLLLNWHPSVSYKANTKVDSTRYSSEFAGSSYGIEVNYRLVNRFYLGINAFNREFNKLKSETTPDLPLTPSWRSLSYGLQFTYFIPFSAFESLPELFKRL